MIKPDGVARGFIGDVIGRFEKNGLKIRAMKMLHLSLDQARAFYAVHKERPFYDSLTQFMSSGPIVAMILEGENAIQVNRDLMGATDYRQADARHHPGGFRPGHRGQHRPRLGRARHRQGRNRLLFQRPGTGLIVSCQLSAVSLKELNPLVAQPFQAVPG